MCKVPGKRSCYRASSSKAEQTFVQPTPQPSTHLAACSGELPGDYGWDPLLLGKEPAKLDRYVELELLHARWAMLGALGALVPGQRAASGKQGGAWLGVAACELRRGIYLLPGGDSKPALPALARFSAPCCDALRAVYYALTPLLLCTLPPLPAELLQLSGATSFLEPRWWNVGYAKLTTGGLTWVAPAGLSRKRCWQLVEPSC